MGKLQFYQEVKKKGSKNKKQEKKELNDTTDKLQINSDQQLNNMQLLVVKLIQFVSHVYCN